MKYSHQRYLRYFVDIQLLSTSNRSSFYDLINCSIESNFVCCLILISVWKRTEIKGCLRVLELGLMKWSARVCHSFKIACASFLKLEGFRIFTHFLRIFLEEKGIFVNKIRNFLWQDTIWLGAPKGFEGHIADDGNYCKSQEGGGGQQADTRMFILETMNLTFCRVI